MPDPHLGRVGDKGHDTYLVLLSEVDFGRQFIEILH